jgi:hypothetical protein
MNSSTLVSNQPKIKLRRLSSTLALLMLTLLDLRDESSVCRCHAGLLMDVFDQLMQLVSQGQFRAEWPENVGRCRYLKYWKRGI